MNHVAWLATFTFVCALLVPGVTGQQGEFVSDPADDVVAVGQGQAAPVPGLAALDLVGATLGETTDQLTFEVEFGGEASAFPENAIMHINWVYGDSYYRIESARYALIDGRYTYAELHHSVDGKEWRQLQDLEAKLSGNGVTVLLPRALIRDSQGASPGLGETLDEMYVVSESRWTSLDIHLPGQEISSPVHLMDRMPDDGGVSYTMLTGLEQSGSVRLGSQAPMRMSNGEATTFVYELSAVAGQAGTYTLSASGGPNTWSVRLPMEKLHLAAGEVVTAPVVISTTFGHRHGATETVRVELAGPGGTGRLDVGIHYPEVAQPGGHHDTVWLHANHADETPAAAMSAVGATFGQDIWMNAIDVDPLDDGEPLRAYLWNTGDDTKYQWRLPLQPGLGMGLDFTDGTGLLDATITAPAGLLSATADARLLYLTPAQDGGENPYWDFDVTELALLATTAPVDLSPGDSLRLQGDLVLTSDAGRLPYVHGSQLFLEISTYNAGPGTFTTVDVPVIEPGAFAKLPLRDYADPVDDVFGGLIDLSVRTPEMAVAPGKSLAIEVELANHQNEADTFELSVSGTGSQWATLAPTKLTVEPHETATIVLTVSPPADATQQADLMLQAQGTKPIATALQRVVVTVDEQAGGDTLDEAAHVESPGVNLVVAGAVILLGSVLRRTRQR